MDHKTPSEIAKAIVDTLRFSSNRMVNGRMVGEQYFAALAITEAIQLDRVRMAGLITMEKVRKQTGSGRLSYEEILTAVNAILIQRAK